MRMILAALCFVLLGAPAFAVPAPEIAIDCYERQSILESLSASFKHRVAAAISHNGELIELFTTSDGDAWTFLLTPPGGLSCVLSEGDSWSPQAFWGLVGGYSL